MGSVKDMEIKKDEWITEPGIYNSEIVGAKEKLSAGGDLQLMLTFYRVDDDLPIGQDMLTFSNKAGGIACAKMRALGIQRNAQGNLEWVPAELVGIRCRISWVKYSFRAKTGEEVIRLRPNIKEPGFRCGYEPKESVKIKNSDDDDIPF